MTALLVLAVTCAIGGVLLWPSPWADPRQAYWRERSRATRPRGDNPALAQELAITAQQLAIALQSGIPVVTALERVAAHCAPELRRHVMPVVTAYERGVEPEAAWRAAPGVWQPIATAFTVAGRAGVAPGPLLRTAAGAVLRRESEHRESAIGRVSVRLVLPLGAVLLPAFMCTTVIPLVIVMSQGFLEG